MVAIIPRYLSGLSQQYVNNSIELTHWFRELLLTCSVLCLVTQSCPALCDPMDCSPPGSSVHGGSPGKSTGVVCHALLQVIFSTQGLNPGLPHGKGILYQLSHQGSPRRLEWIAYPFSRESSPPRDLTRVSRITCRLFTNWATRESCY